MKLCLCCISNTLADNQKKSFKTMTWKRFKEFDEKIALGILSEKIINNFSVTADIIYYCKNSGIDGYRFSSSLMPLLNHPEMKTSFYDLPKIDEILKAINEIKKAVKETKLKFSAHPGEFITLTSEDENAIKNSIRDLEQHAFLFDLLELEKDYTVPLNIHCRKDGNPEEISNRFFKNFDKLSDSVKKRLVVEVNDNKNGTWTIANLHKYFYLKNKIPITFDSLHHKILHGGLSEKDAFELAYSTWPVIPVFHYSEGINETRSHADYASELPNSYGKEVYWDVELKAKDYAILKMKNLNIL